MNPQQRAHRQGTLVMLVLICIWGAFLPVAKSALKAVDPYWLTAMRFGTAAAVFLILLALREGIDKLSADGRSLRLMLFGACGFGGFGICLFEGLRLTRPEIGAMILALGPIQIALWQWWRTRERPDGFTQGVIVLALAGELLVVTAGDIGRLAGGHALGNGLVLLASLFWTGYTIGSQQFPGWSAVRYTALSCSFGCLTIAAALAIATLADHSRIPGGAELIAAWPELVYTVFFVSILGILFWNVGVSRLGPLSAGLFANFAPVITYLIAIAQGRRPDAPELAGALLVLTALVANNRHQRRKLQQLRQHEST